MQQAAPEVRRLWQQMSRADSLRAREANEASGEAHVSDNTAGGGSGDALRDFCTGHAEPSDGETAKVAEDTTADVAAAKAAAKAAEDSAAAAKAAEDAAAAQATEDAAAAAAKAAEDAAAASKAARRTE